MSTAAAAREHVVWVTAADRTVDHAVTSRELSAGVVGRAERGFESVCGDRFPAAPMISEPGPTCSRCACILRARASLRVIEPHRQTAIGRWLSAVLPDSDAPRPGVRSGRVAPSPRPRGGVA